MAYEITGTKALGIKCARCWKYREDVIIDHPIFPGICEICFQVVMFQYETKQIEIVEGKIERTSLWGEVPYEKV